MPAIQSTYTGTIAKGFPGMVANGETSNRISRTVEDAAGVGFGKAVFRGAGDHGCTGTPSALFLGITMADHAIQPLPGGVAVDVIPQYGSAGILTDGDIWVTTSTSATPGAQVYVTPAGLFTTVSSSNTILARWVFDDTAAANAIVRIVYR